jgi:hypothetical protein
MTSKEATMATKAQKERVSFTIPAELYDEFTLYAFTKQVSLSTVFRHALKEFAEITFPDPVADAEFDLLFAKTQAEQSIAGLPKPSAGWVN